MIANFINLVEQTDISIAVVGDCVLDEYYKVRVERISPEAPCPIFSTEEHEADVHLPGGAGNVCYQMKPWSVDVQLYGIMDELSKKHYDKYRINTNRCPMLTASRIPIKRRYMCGDTQVARLDIESEWYGTGLMPLTTRQNKLAENFHKDPEPNILVLSDYGKGVFANSFSSQLIGLCTGTNTTIIVDPKDGPIEQWRGCHVFKPNNKEAITLSGGLTRSQEQADYFMEKLGCEAVVITHGGDGVCGKVKDKYFDYLTPGSCEKMKDIAIRSVCGAGDCFVAFLAMALSVKIPVDEAAKIAFEAGAIYVTHRFNQPVKPTELSNNTIDIADLKHPRDFKLVFTNGCFDAGLTAGHIECLKFAKAQGDRLVVAINSDDSVRRLKGNNRPYLPLVERMKIVSALKMVDYVISFDENTPLKLIEELMPEIVVKGGDYQKEDVVGYGIAEVVICPMHQCISTTEKLAKINRAGISTSSIIDL